MRIISKRRFREFCSGRADAEVARKAFKVFARSVKPLSWPDFASIRRNHPSADLVGNCVVFNVGGNKYRLIARINHRRDIIYVLAVMDHAQYDRRGEKNRPRWIADCGCHEPPPGRP